MSTLKADTVQSKSSNTDLTIAGDGSGVPNLEAGFKVGGVAGVPTASIRDDAITSAKIADDAVTLATMASGTDGVIITYDASGNPVHVGPGSDGQVLTSTGAGSPPAFEALPGGGKILQVVSTFNNDYASHSNTNVDNVVEIVTAAITPAATSAKILIMGHFTGSSTSSDVQFLGLNLYRDSTAIGLGDASSRNGTEGVLHTAQFRDDHYSKPSSTSFHFVDSPSSTSSITYRLKCFANHVSGSSLSNLTLIQNSGGYNYNNKEQAVGTTTLILMEIGA